MAKRKRNSTAKAQGGDSTRLVNFTLVWGPEWASAGRTWVPMVLAWGPNDPPDDEDDEDE